MFDRSAAPGLSGHEAVIDVLARAGHSLGIREIARSLEVNASTASRRVRDLRTQGWLVTIAEIQGWAAGDDERDLRVTLNPDRPGLKEYLDWMHIEYGTDREAFWRFVKQLRSRDWGYPPPLTWPDPEEPLSTMVRRLLPDVSHQPIPAPYYRALTGRMREVSLWPRRTERLFSSLYGTSAGASERYRDFIHLMGHLGRALRGFPDTTDEEDARPELAELAVTAHHNAVVFTAYAQGVFEAAVIGRYRDRSLRLLAEWARNHILPGAEPDGFGFTGRGEELLAVERLRHIYAQLDAGSPSGWKYYRHGGMPGRDDVGGGGDGLLAQMMLHQAHQAQAVADDIAVMPGMSDVLAVPIVAAQLEHEIPEELMPPTVSGKDLQIQTVWPDKDSRHDEQTGDVVIETMTIPGHELRVGDRIFAVDDHQLIEPLRVEALSKSGTVTLAEGLYAVPVTTAGFLDDKAVIVSRRITT